ncbi:MAG TPA: radical SAM protein [Thermoanaerobaculia bacterium]|nr:radical SAM protein [Thermoanaerobaculia bacterium]
MRRRHQPQRDSHSWEPFLASERPVRPFPRSGRFSLGLAYANTYHVGMSSLGFQRVYELTTDRPDWRCERFFLDGTAAPLSLETGRPLNALGVVAFSVSFEEDYVHLLQMLERARIPIHRRDRGSWDPLVVMGGSCASINPLPMATFVDVFPLGAAENTLPALLAALEEEPDRPSVLERLAATPGFFVPAHHHPEDDPDFGRLEKLELTAEQFRQPGYLPTTAIVTPRTEFADKFLIEMSRGCPEKCKYCWATFGMGTFRWHPTEFILASLERARAVTDQVGFVATAVGDHPEVEHILLEALRLGFRSSVSSIRIPAVTEGVLEALYRSGDRSITLAPETGNDSLRRHLNKPITNASLLEKIRLIFRHGFTQLKLYFLVGIPGESLADVQSILDLAAEARSIMLESARQTGVIGHVQLGCNILVPKPFTPWQREPVEAEGSLKAKIELLRRGVAKLPNVSMNGALSIRQARWQTYLSKAGSEAAGAIERVARGESLASVLRGLDAAIGPEISSRMDGELRWHFLHQRNTNLPALEQPVAVAGSSPAI